MSKKLSRSDALEEISTWTNDDVLRLLQKYGLEKCCKTIAKRQIDGDELLHLTEGKLVLWKSDLTRPLLWDLWAFIEEVRKSPEKFVEEKFLPQVDDHLSDNDYWGTDFEDDDNEDSAESEIPTGQSNPGRRSDKNCLQEAAGRSKDGNTDGISRQEEEGTYANCGSLQDDKNTYENFQDFRILPPKNTSKLHNQTEKSLVDQMKEQLELMNIKKLVTGPKPESLKTRTIGIKPQESFLHSAPNPKVPSQMQKRMAVPPPPDPKKTKKQTVITDKLKKEPAKPPTILKNLDLVANLPAQTEGSEDEYEKFNEQIIEQNQKKNMLRVDSKQSLASGHQSSAESVYQPPSVTSYEEEEEYACEIYESITETPDDNNYYLSPIQKTPNVKAPSPLPARPPKSSASPSPTLNRTNLKRSPDKKSATLPHSNSNTSLSSERATRPLPPPPERHSYVDKPWFHNVTREQAMALISEQSSYGNPQDGYFLLRPSVTNVNHPLALVLWYKDRVYNIPVRKRPDNRYALGFAKVNEQSFTNVEEIVMFHTREELVLHSGGGEIRSTKLIDTPPK